MSAQDSSQLYLSPNQQDLLMAALNSNQSSQPARQSSKNATTNTNGHQKTGSASLASVMNGQTDLFGSPIQSAPGSGNLDFGTDESPYLDFDLDGEGEDGFDFSGEGQMIGDLPEDNSGNDDHHKRKSIPDAEEDDEGGGKRRESDDKSGKKPGRKPLTSEPTTKRKAQNRAAQRAFRERKEQHLKDLETKVEDLEKASEAANHENGLLKAQVERQQVELKEYRKRLSWVGQNAAGRGAQPSTNMFGSQQKNNGYSNDFQFEFPKFGDLPANNLFDSSSTTKQQINTPARSSTLPNNTNSGIPGVLTRNSMSSASPRNQTNVYGATSSSPIANNISAPPVSQAKQNNSVDSLSGLFSPSILEASRQSNGFGYFPQNNGAPINNQAPRGSFDQNSRDSIPALYASSSNTDSPASSSDSHNHVSSIGTSPEPSLSSPGNKVNDYSLNTINEEGNLTSTFGGTAITPGFDSDGINWLAQQNGGIFDPELFGDYRESQDAVVSQDFGAFFNDAFPLPDLGSPEHPYNVIAASPAPKVDLMKQVEAAREGEEHMVPGEDRAKMMTCNKIWDRLQSMEKFRNGEIDVDNLCSELRRKAKCSEGGAVVDEKDVNTILGKAK